MDESACIIHGGMIDKDGYGVKYRDGKKRFAHRLAWDDHYGPIPDGMVIDHLCWNRACINIDHLRLLSPVENCKRQRLAEAARCKKGHLFDEANTYIRPDTMRRQCRACNYIRVENYLKRKASQASAQSPTPKP